CRHLHGHNYKFHFKVAPKKGSQEINSILLDDVGRVIDFSVVKTTLCQWLEDNWDHKFLHWEEDPLIKALQVDCELCDETTGYDVRDFDNSLVSLPFNPTAENLAAYMVDV